MRRKLLSVLTLLTCLITAQSINQPINQPIDQSVNQPIDQSHDQPTDQSTNQSINQSKLGIWWAPVVNTTSGLYQGYTYQSINYYMGMRYAQRPINQLRFAHPQPINQPIDQSVNRAYFHGSMCPQIIAGPLWLGNEDCLYINVYAPVNDQSTHQATHQSTHQSTDKTTQSTDQPINQSLKPVFVWIYGGSFVFGDGYEFGLYEASNMVLNSDVVVVTFNYRLGPLGFMALDALSKNDSRGATGNAGLADQRLALQWVHDNIREFGGDPDRVTIGGESAGAMSVCSQMAHQLHLTHQSTNPSTKQSKDQFNDRASDQSTDQSKDPLFHRVIMQSGTCDSSTFWPDRQSSIDWSLYYASMLGCSFNQSTNQPTGLEDSDRLVDCLRKLPLDVFVKASKSKNINPSSNPSVHPSNNQSTSQPSDYDEWSVLTKEVMYNPRSNEDASLEDVAQWHAEQTAESTHESIKRSINQSVKQSVNPPPLPILYPAVPWTPVIDGVFLTDTPLSMIESIYKSTSQSTSQSTDQPINQSVKPLPVLIGTNLDEGTLFLRQLYQILPDQLHDPLVDSDLPLIYEHVFGNQSINQSNNQTIIELINQHYPPSDYESINELIEVLLRDYIFACPSRRLLSTIYQSVNHQPTDQPIDQSTNQSANQSTWLYQYRYNPGWIDNYFLGIYHSAELEFVFGNAWPPIIHPFDETSRLIVDLIGDKWGNFMKYGNPNQPTNQSINQPVDQSIFWPAWNPATKLNLQIEHPPSINQHLLDTVCHFWDSVDQSINQSMKQSKQKKLKQALQSINQPVDQSTDQSASQPSQAHPREVFASE